MFMLYELFFHLFQNIYYDKLKMIIPKFYIKRCKILSSLGSRIRQLRTEKKLTQEQLGRLINVGKSTISQYENNINTPEPKIINMLADYFDCSVDYLLCRTDERQFTSIVKESSKTYTTNDPLLDNLLIELSELTEEEKEFITEHIEFALKQIKKLRPIKN